MAIVYLDCYPVHTGEAFRCYVWQKFPYIILCFVPANCTPVFHSKQNCQCTDVTRSGTGKMQPADVGLNWVIKHRLKQAQINYLVKAHQQQLSNELTPEQVKISISLPELRDASVAGIVEVYDFMTGPTR